MVLVDTSVWVDHFRSGNFQLEKFLHHGDVVCHPFVMGELACGNIKHRKRIFSLLSELPIANGASHQEVLKFIEFKKLMGKGLGYIDVHLLAAAFLSNVSLWTLDKKLNAISTEMKVALKSVSK